MGPQAVTQANCSRSDRLRARSHFKGGEVKQQDYEYFGFYDVRKR